MLQATPAGVLDPPHRPRSGVLAAAVLAITIAVAHGGSLWDGYFFDDYWHRVTLHEYPWTWDGCIEAATFDVPGQLANLWWQTEPLQWRYARPVAMALMKVEHFASGGDARVIHAFSLAWHWLAAMLVFAIARRLLGARQGETGDGFNWALLAALLFALHPQSVFCLSWTAARNALIGGVFFFAAILAYVASAQANVQHPDSLLGHPSLAVRSRFRLLAALAMWMLALLSRETSIVLPLLLPFVDHAVGGFVLVRRRWGIYSLFAALLAIYLVWRLAIFPTGGPPQIYFTTPRGAEYLLWAAAKLLHMLFAMFIHTPMFLGVATATDASAGWLDYAMIALGVGLLVAIFARFSRGERARWLCVAWCVLAFVPVIPVFVMPHFAYLAAPAAAMAAAMVVRGLPRWRAAASALLVLYFAWPLGLYRFAWRGIVRCEQVIYAAIAEQTPIAPPAGAKLYFINLPIAGIYATVAMREQWQQPALDGYVLTFAPHPLAMDEPFRIEKLSDRAFRLSADRPIWFAGRSGRMLIDGMRRGEALVSGARVSGVDFDVTIENGDAAGVRAMRFDFHKPLSSPDMRFFVTTPDRPAVAIDWSRDPMTQLAAPWAPSPRIAEMLREREYYFDIVGFVRRFIRSDVYMTGD